MKLIRLISVFIILSMLFSTMSYATASELERNDEPLLIASEAPEWTALFDRRGNVGWLGADGIYSVSLDGNDAFASATSATDTAFIFSDTLMGMAAPHGEVVINAGMPSHTAATLKGGEPNADAISFVYGYGGNGTMGEHMFGEHKWLFDCYVQNDTMYILGFPEESWKPTRIDMISVPIRNGVPIYNEYYETENIAQLWHKTSDEYLYAFGIGINANTESAGAVTPDGYVYVYGYRDALKEMSRKDLIVGRIHESDFPDFSKFSYWDGESWCNNIEESAVILSAVSCEMSVSYIPVGPFSGKYIAVYTEYTRSANIMYAIADTPYGPFDTPVKCYDAPEHGMTGASGNGVRVVYNAKAHPHLSKEDKLLISYNVNVEVAEQWSVDYHPRFICLDLDPGNEESSAMTPTDKATSWINKICVIGACIGVMGVGAYFLLESKYD